MSSNTKFAIGVTIPAVLIFAAAFMPWGHFPGGSTPFQGMQSVFAGALEEAWTTTGWNGNITVAAFVDLRMIHPVTLPNWLVVLAAASVAALGWLKAASVWDAPSVVLFGLAGYGLLHAGFAFVALMAIDNGSAGVGSFLTALAFVGILVILVQQVRSPKTPSAPNQPLQPTGPA